MNEVIRLLTSHRSYRQYTKQTVEPEKLKAIIEAAQAAPSWVNGQQVSIVAVRSEERRQQLSVLSGNQKHVAEAPVFLVFCMDFHRARLAAELEEQPFEAAGDIDALLVGATDVGIALSNAVAAAESLGLGIIPIGGIRRNTAEVIKLLQLPEYVFPVAGLCIGYPAGELPQKPRLPLEAVYHEEVYNPDQKGLIRNYNKLHRESLKAQGVTERDWSSTIARFYALNPQYGDAGRTLPRQGFTSSNLEN
ncbi:NADPH-dependent oxidoreductase [Paenibacillus sp. MMS20-IR301]|uniref:NADPH-dependent oxidoreductase n=1 Tax=Paenibacillus sp. MMS20-IR301 TaxID=2895946 RepID=UPI0028E9A384|nr:NADPH-dependent oxidoreductase [Paenibacillus sp. MMS20-IR301]WNS43356.1 NADPH-dependent oxidoreductase [Paenibacillus sp. MMS20-IR301]